MGVHLPMMVASFHLFTIVSNLQSRLGKRDDSLKLLYGLLAQFAAAPADLRELIAPFKWPHGVEYGSAVRMIPRISPFRRHAWIQRRTPALIDNINVCFRE